jgi:hypothetical protein
MAKVKNITGTWQGVYSFDDTQILGLQSVPFTLTIKQRWFGRFRGTVTDDAPPGMPGAGAIEGYFSFPRIEFMKAMPVCYIATPDRRVITLREYLIENGETCEHDVPHRPILYEGSFLSPTRAEGTWIIKAGVAALGDGRGVRLGEVTGTWTMQPRAA